MVATSSFLLNIVHGVEIGKMRKKAGIVYPQHYATEAQVEKSRDGKPAPRRACKAKY